MTRGAVTLTPEQLTAQAAQIAWERGGDDVRILDLRRLTVIADYFIIASADNTVATRALCDAISDRLAERGSLYARREGYDESRWILLDYNDIMIHIFLEEDRRLFDLERLWGDAPGITVDDDVVQRLPDWETVWKK